MAFITFGYFFAAVNVQPFPLEFENYLEFTANGGIVLQIVYSTQFKKGLEQSLNLDSVSHYLLVIQIVCLVIPGVLTLLIFGKVMSPRLAEIIPNRRERVEKDLAHYATAKATPEWVLAIEDALSDADEVELQSLHSTTALLKRAEALRIEEQLELDRIEELEERRKAKAREEEEKLARKATGIDTFKPARASIDAGNGLPSDS